MAELKNIHQLEGVLPADVLNKIEAGALLNRRHASIIFKIKEVDADKKSITIQVVQEKNSLDKYLTTKELVNRTLDFFEKFFHGWAIHAHATPYAEPVVNEVTDGWLRKVMKDNNINVKTIVADTGIDKTNISAWVNGKRPMSQITKSLLYYYFKYKTSKAAGNRN